PSRGGSAGGWGRYADVRLDHGTTDGSDPANARSSYVRSDMDQDRYASASALLVQFGPESEPANRGLGIDPLQGLTHGDALHQLSPLVFDIADLGSDLPRLDAAAVGLHHCRRLVGRAPHPVIELPIVQHDWHSVVILGDARRSVGGDDGEAGYLGFWLIRQL